MTAYTQKNIFTPILISGSLILLISFANVELISGPVQLKPIPKVKTSYVQTSKDMMDMVMRVDAEDRPAKDVNIAGRQMPLEMRLIVWNLRNCAPKDGYTNIPLNGSS